MLLRISNIILSVVMVVITTGFSASRHFCHDRLVNTELFSMVAESCHEIPIACCEGKDVSRCGKDVEQEDCCKNENALVKFTEQFTVNQKFNPGAQLFGLFSFTVLDFRKSNLLASDLQLEEFRIEQPPPYLVSIRTLTHSFLI